MKTKCWCDSCAIPHGWQNSAFYCVKQSELKSMYFGDQWDKCMYHINKYDNEQQKVVNMK